jgi:uncharacterized protein YggU (UPF0235/DUF167 family)
MEHRDYHLHNGKKGAALAIRVIFNALKNEITDILQDGTIRIRLFSTSSDANINRELSKFLSQVLNVTQSKIEIVAGENGHEKLVSVLDLDAESVQKKILAHLQK